MRYPQPYQQGFTLLELLIAVLVVSIGLLGHASLQAKSSRITQQASFDQSANTMMADLLQRVSAQPEAAISNEFNSSNLSSGDAPSSQDCSGVTSACDRAQFAAYELASWYQQASSLLPELRYSLARQDNSMHLKLVWDAGLSGAGAADCSAANGHQCREVQLWLR